MNDAQRQQWVDNDEGLYDDFLRSRKSIRNYIRENRKMIDECIEKVTSGERRAHYLKYG